MPNSGAMTNIRQNPPLNRARQPSVRSVPLATHATKCFCWYKTNKRKYTKKHKSPNNKTGSRYTQNTQKP